MVMASIFVQIPSYHDYELYRTIINCIKSSSGENQINFGVHISYYLENNIEIPNVNNLKVNISQAPENIGVGQARYIANEFYNGEDYYLQIDSHMRFEQDWDKNLISTYLKYKSEGLNPVISTYPGAYDYSENKLRIINNKNDVSYIDFIQELSFDDNYIPHQRAVANFEDNIFNRSVSAASIFSSGEIAKIKPNQNIYFWGEEIVMAARFFTHGFDLMLPEQQNLYHLYYNHELAEKNLRRQSSFDFPEICTAKEMESQKEVTSILLGRKMGPEGLGIERSIKEYEEYARVDFLAKKVLTML
jgi:hypothetical protein